MGELAGYERRRRSTPPPSRPTRSTTTPLPGPPGSGAGWCPASTCTPTCAGRRSRRGGWTGWSRGRCTPGSCGRSTTATPWSVVPVGDGGLEVRDSSGAVCAVGDGDSVALREWCRRVGDWPDVAPAVDPPPAAPRRWCRDGVRAGAPRVPRRAWRGSTSTPCGRRSRCTRQDGIAHPAWILRDANYVAVGQRAAGAVDPRGVDGPALRRRPRRVGRVGPGPGGRRARAGRAPVRDARRAAPGRRTEPVARTTHIAIHRPKGT